MRTSELSAQEKEDLGTRVPPSTGLSQDLCVKGETLPREMVVGGVPYTENSLRMRTLFSSTLALVSETLN